MSASGWTEVTISFDGVVETADWGPNPMHAWAGTHWRVLVHTEHLLAFEWVGLAKPDFNRLVVYIRDDLREDFVR